MTSEQQELEDIEQTILGYERKRCEWCIGAGCTVCNGRGFTWWWRVNDVGNVTGRLSSNRPNIQNISHQRYK